MALKKDITLPKTIGRLSQSVDFVGYIYPQIATTNGIDVFTKAAADTSNYLLQLVQKSLNDTGFALGGITSITKTFNRDVMERRLLGNYEVIQNYPGKIGVKLTLNKVVFYKDQNILDGVLSINSSGVIKQSAPLMIIENMERPLSDEEEDTGALNIESIMYLDCWFTQESVAYQLDGKHLVVSKLNINPARVFTKVDYAQEGLNAANKLLNIPNIDLPISNFKLNIPF